MSITSQRLSDEAVRGLVHPHTGKPLSPLGFRADGRAIFPILGASEDDDSNDSDQDEDDNPEGSDESGDEDGPEDDESSEDDPEPAANERLKAKNREIIQENQRFKKQRDEAKSRADDLQKQIDELKAKGAPGAEEIQKELDDTKASNQKLQEQLKQARIENSFYAVNEYEWQNPVSALKLTDLSEVEIDDDGSVHGMDEALAKTAKEHPYLLKSKQKAPPKKSGDAPKGKKDDKQTKAEKEAELKKKYRITR